MYAWNNISLQRFGRLMACFPIGRIGRRFYWACICDCGNTCVVRGTALVAGNTTSCGCWRHDAQVTHGHLTGGASKTYRSWDSAIQRCTNPNEIGWIRYGGANPPVTICERWRTFENFLADMGERPEGATLGRFGDVGNYEPGNCAWQTKSQQLLEAKIKRWNRQLQAA
jgi:hypothetical protein